MLQSLPRILHAVILGRVDSLMCGQGAVGTEAPPTLITDVRGVPRVGSQVPRELGAGNESFPALAAAIGPLPCVDPLVRVPG